MHGTWLRRGEDAPAGHGTPGEGVPFTLDRGGDDALAVEAAPTGALVRLRRRADGAYLSAGNQGGAVAWSGEPRDWETFLPIDEATVDAIRRMAALPVLRHGATEPVPAGGFGLAPGFNLTIGDTTHTIAAGLSAALLGDDDTPRLVLTIGGSSPASRRGALSTSRPSAQRVLLSRFAPVVIWRHDGSDTADEEIALGLRSLRTHGGFHGRVLAAIRDPAAVAALLDDAGPFEPTPADPGAPPIPNGAGPALILANGVFCAGPVAPLFAAASAGFLLAAPWRRIGEDPFGTTGRAPVEDTQEHRDATAVDPAIVALPGAGRDRRILAATFAAGGQTDGETAERLRVLALASGTLIDATALDRFVASWRPDRDDRPLAPLVNARPLSRTLRVAAIRDVLASHARPADPA